MGCGPGHITGWLAARGATAVRIDLSPGMIEVADFRFHQPQDVAAALEAAGFTLRARLERVAYPAEVDTRRAYLLDERPV
ncbi:MAG TPA: methyltransferase domain-containing protein [Streptosporangiaceae bacterium]|nr:methyltransferase domain-containing protein [Streptosporangiaceae bacterium]